MIITINKLKLFTHTIMEGTQAMLLSTIMTLFYSVMNFEVMGFTAGTLLVLLLFVTMDYFTGVSVAVSKGEKVSSKKGRESVYKIAGYVMIILFLAVVEFSTHTTSGYSFGTVTISFFRHFILCLMLLWEFHSVGENIEERFGKKPRIFYFVEVTTQMLEEKLMSGLENMLKPNINVIDENKNKEEGKEEISET